MRARSRCSDYILLVCNCGIEPHDVSVKVHNGIEHTAETAGSLEPLTHRESRESDTEQRAPRGGLCNGIERYRGRGILLREV